MRRKNKKDTREVLAEMNRKRLIAEAREVAKIFNDFADALERIEKKYAELEESEEVAKIFNDFADALERIEKKYAELEESESEE